MRERIFLSYSHTDRVWRDRFEAALGGGIYSKKLDLWSDQDIRAGADWQQEITAAIATSRVALLLVSRNFLRSDFIVNDELRQIFKRRGLALSDDPEGLSIWWVPLEPITQIELKLAELDPSHAVLSPDRPLSQLDERERDNEIANIAVRLIHELKVLPDFDAASRDEFRNDVILSLGSRNTILKEAIAPGDFSIIYRAERRGVPLAVKALIPSKRMPWMADDFVKRADIVKQVRHEAAIAIREVTRETPVKCVVMDYVATPTIKSLTRRGQDCLSCSDAAAVLSQLAELAAVLHKLDADMIVGPIRPSHVHFDVTTKKVQLSLIRIANETLGSCRQRPTVLFDTAALTYLSPERYHGQPVNALSDQYYLGLLGLELLQGRPPVEVTTFSRLEAKAQFFDDPRKFFGDLPQRNPDLSFVLARMLEQDPLKRWPSMSMLAEALSQIARNRVPDVVRNHAIELYKTRMRENIAFFQAFYRSLCDSSEHIAQLFDSKRVTMDVQYQKLSKAIGFIFSFDRQIEPTTLEPQIESHGDYALEAEHFRCFGKSFLEALAAIDVNDSYSLDAWRAVLDPPLAYMQQRIAANPANAHANAKSTIVDPRSDRRTLRRFDKAKARTKKAVRPKGKTRSARSH